jgi:hypothetical protein
VAALPHYPSNYLSFVPPHCADPFGLCRADLSIDIGPSVDSLLSGAFRFQTATDFVTVSGANGVWSGVWNGDLVRTTIVSFTGHWGLTQVVPEPATFALVGAALLGLAATRRRNGSTQAR